MKGDKSQCENTGSFIVLKRQVCANLGLFLESRLKK